MGLPPHRRPAALRPGRRRVATLAEPHPVASTEDINRALEHAGNLAQILQDAERETTAPLYQALDLTLNLDPVGDPSDPGRPVAAMRWRGWDLNPRPSLVFGDRTGRPGLEAGRYPRVMRLTAAIGHEGDWYVARCLEVEVTSQGRTVDEAHANLAEALGLYFEDERGFELPEPLIITPVDVPA